MSTNETSPTQGRSLWGAALLFVLVLLVGISSGIANAETPEPLDSRVPGRYIVIFKDSVDHPRTLAEAQTEQKDGELGFVYRHALKGYSAELSRGAVEALRKDPRVKYVSPDHYEELQEQKIPAGIPRIGALSNPQLDIDGFDDTRVDADVAVIDSGIDHEHPDLNVVARTFCEVNLTTFELGCVDDTGDDTHGHGTHVAGTIGALDNGIGVVGVAPGVRLWSVKVMQSGTIESEIAAGVDWVTAHADQIEVANMSIGCGLTYNESGELVPCPRPVMYEAISNSVEAGVVYAVSAGNASVDAKYNHPSYHPDVITVSAVADYDGESGGKATPLATPNKSEVSPEKPYCGYLATSESEHSGLDDKLAKFSNYGETIEVGAPGVCVYSTLPKGLYGFKSGTSMAAPHAAGAAAILASQTNPEDKQDVERIREIVGKAGTFDWTDTSPDGIKEPLLRVSGLIPLETRLATNVTSSSAKLNGAVNPLGAETTYWFEYGTTTAYGTNVPVSPKAIGSSYEAINASQSVSGLSSNTVYHFRLATEAGGGKRYGEDQVFDTYPHFNVDEAPATITGKQSPQEKVLRARIDIAGGSQPDISCIEHSFSGEMKSTGSQTLTVTPVLGECNILGMSATFEARGCAFVLHVSGTVDVAGTKCAGEPMRLSNGGSCVVTIGPQTNLSKATYANHTNYNTFAGKRYIAAEFDLAGLTYTATGVSCPEAGTFSNGAFRGLLQSVEASKGFWVGEDGQFHLESAPATITGKQSPQEKVLRARIDIAGGSQPDISCIEHSFSGEMKSTGSQTLTVTPVLGECNILGMSATFEARGCAFVLHVSGTVDVAGTKCAGEPMRLSNGGSCVVTIGPQTNLSKATYANHTNYNTFAGKRYIAAEFDLAGLTYTATGVSCPEAGTFSNGAFRGLLQSVEGVKANQEAQSFWVDS